ncbi:hypothetical protein Hokovirus_3_296 [Hokovirus HKV1]|uniref:Uncharacterized protein n=1 Tax=Hokovirus HKV1 TaxID=1977638 RepID=A0A1V0SH39_9VIRU|nr:hypothetical protein Hokovirus_3_296 [Hokovirus HKV1]
MYKDYDNNCNIYTYRMHIKNEEYLCFHYTTLFVFEVLDYNIDKKYIFFSDFSKIFYETNEYIKLDYIAINKIKLQLHINTTFTNNFNFLDDQNNNINNNDYFEVFNKSIHVRNIEDSYNKNILIKGIQKN